MLRRTALSIICLFFVFLLFSQEVNVSPIVKQENGKSFYIHTIQKGETLYSISRAYKVSVDEIIMMNPQVQDGLKVYQEIKIEKKDSSEVKASVPTSATYVNHIVRANETLESIAKVYGVSSTVIRNTNPHIIMPLQKDQILRIPLDFNVENIKAKPTKEFHVVKAKETIYGIARQYSITPDQLRQANPQMTSIKPGDTLFLPSKEVEQTPIEKSSGNAINGLKHTVEPKETLYGIARKYGVSVTEIKEINPNLPDALVIGQVINIPDSTGHNGFIIHKSQNNENMSDIAENYKVDKKVLETLNPGIGRKIDPSESVRIPVEGKSVPVSSGNCNRGDYRDDTFNISLLIPLSLSRVDSAWSEKDGNISSFRFLSFYEGMLVALDSLQKAGANINLRVYDIPKDNPVLSKVLQKPELKESDLIIGLLFADDFEKAAKYAKQNNIPIVNPLSRRRDVINDNQWVIKVYPDKVSQQEMLARVFDQTTNNQVYIVRANKFQSADYANSLYKKLKEVDRIDPNRFSRIRMVVDSVSWVKQMTQNDENPTVLVVAENPAYVMDFLRKMGQGAVNGKIRIIGLPNWQDIDKLEVGLIDKLNFHFLAPYLVDYKNEDVKGFISTFRNRFAAEPDELAYSGFDLTWFFSHSMIQFGDNFIDCLNSTRAKCILSAYDFEKSPNKGIENRFWNIYHVEQFKPVIINR